MRKSFFIAKIFFSFLQKKEWITTVILIFSVFHSSNAGDTTLVLKKIIRGGLSPKSVVYNGNGLFFAQNMMYNHTITVYDKDYNLVKVINDKVDLEAFGHSGYQGEYKGSPVECAFSHNGEYAWVSNYTMSGKGFDRPGCDSCSGTKYDPGFIYKINTKTLKIEKIIKAGSVPKFLAVSNDNKLLLVSNWSSADVSVIDLENESEKKRVPVGKFPRGIAIDNQSQYAYVAVMGSNYISKVSLSDFTSAKFVEVGKGPRHLCIDKNNQYLYVTINSEGKIARVNLMSGAIDKIHVGGTPRSMTLSDDNRFIYVVNYSSSKITKISTSDFKVLETANTGANPIGITYNHSKAEIWVACYSGSLMIFEDRSVEKVPAVIDDYTVLIPALNEFYSSAIKILIPPPGDRIETSKMNTAEKNKSVTENKTVENKITPVIDSKETKPVSSSQGENFVIVGSFKNPDNAKRKRDEMVKKGYQCEIIERPNGMHYAAVGGYKSKADAETIKTKIISSGMDAWVWKRE